MVRNKRKQMVNFEGLIETIREHPDFKKLVREINKINKKSKNRVEEELAEKIANFVYDFVEEKEYDEKVCIYIS